MTVTKSRNQKEQVVSAKAQKVDFGTTLSISSGLAGEYWCFSLADSLEEPGMREAIETLGKKCPGSNPFYQLAVLEPASHFLGRGTTKYLSLSRHDQASTELRFFMPVTVEDRNTGGHRILESWNHDFGPLGTPLAYAPEPSEFLNALTHSVSLARPDEFSALVINDLPKDAWFSRTLFSSPTLADRLLRFSPSSRAAVFSRTSLDEAVSNISGKRKQRLALAHRKLSQLGTIKFVEFKTKADAHSALADQLQIENEGWKGRNGTAILNRQDVTDFVTSAVHNLFERQQCRLFALTLKGIPIASMIMIQDGNKFYPWKIAFDERYGSYSVGNLLLTEVNAELKNNTNFHSLDSLASELNATARRFWPDSRTLTSMVIAFGQDAGNTAIQIAQKQQSRHEFKRWLKRKFSRSL